METVTPWCQLNLGSSMNDEIWWDQQQGSAKPKAQTYGVKFWTDVSSRTDELQSPENIYKAHVDRPITTKEVLL